MSPMSLPALKSHFCTLVLVSVLFYTKSHTPVWTNQHQDNDLSVSYVNVLPFGIEGYATFTTSSLLFNMIMPENHFFGQVRKQQTFIYAVRLAPVAQQWTSENAETTYMTTWYSMCGLSQHLPLLVQGMPFSPTSVTIYSKDNCANYYC